MLPIVPFILVMGMGFGAAARETGLTLWLAVFMSAVVFAGGSQFAALELWEEPVAWLALALTIFAVNARHLVMGAVLSPWLSHLPAMRQYAAVIVMSDLNWASAISAFRRGEQGVGLLIGGGLAIWVAWVVGTAAGATSSSAISDAHMFGIDAVMPAFFCTVLFDGQRKSRRWFVGLVAAASAWMATMVLPPYWVVLAGVVAGVITSVVSHER